MRRTVPATAALALTASLALSGCFANPLDGLVEGLVEGGVEQLIENQTGVDVDLGGSGGSLPSSWPAEVPTVSGEIAYSAAFDGNFSASLTVGSIEAAQRAFSDLEAAGYTVTGEMQLGDGIETRTFENDTYNVVVVIAPNDDGTASVQYQITGRQ